MCLTHACTNMLIGVPPSSLPFSQHTEVMPLQEELLLKNAGLVRGIAHDIDMSVERAQARYQQAASEVREHPANLLAID